MSNFSHKRILILAANPKNSSTLRLGEEVREIDEGLKRSRHHDQFELVSKWAVRSRDFYRHMLDVQPHIAHFSGHGTGEDGIVLEDEDGKIQLVSTNALESLFKLFASKGLECVLLNACFSEIQAEAISQHIPYVIGMKKGIGDKAAIVFAVAFYDALGAGEIIEFAFDLACAAIQMENIPENLTPVLKKNLNLGHEPLSVSPNSPKSRNNLTANQYRRLERERDELQGTYDIYSKKLLSLRNARAMETDVSVKLKLDVQIEETKEELNKLEQQLDLIEKQLT
jgi:hypothetical protein